MITLSPHPSTSVVTYLNHCSLANKKKKITSVHNTGHPHWHGHMKELVYRWKLQTSCSGPSHCACRKPL